MAFMWMACTGACGWHRPLEGVSLQGEQGRAGALLGGVQDLLRFGQDVWGTVCELAGGAGIWRQRRCKWQNLDSEAAMQCC